MLTFLRCTVFHLIIGSLMIVSLFPSTLLAAAVPSVRDVVVMPGESASIEIPVENQKTVSVDVALQLFSAEIVSGEEQPMIQELDAGIAGWVSLSTGSMILAGGEQDVMVVTVHPPADAQPQSFILALVATEIIEGDIALVHGAATLIFVTVGDVPTSAQCVDFVRNTDDGATLTLMNTGSGILYANGAVVLRGMFGIRFGTTPMNPMGHRIAANQTRSWTVSLPAIPWWAFGALHYSIDDEQIADDGCDSIAIGTRWLPIVGIGVAFITIFMLGFGILRRVSHSAI